MAARFWVGGTGTWNATNTANWSATTGGTAGASVPGPADTVTFDANSGTGFTCTVATGYNPTVISVTGGFATVTLNLNDQTLTCVTFNFSGAAAGAVRALAWGTSGQITITGSGTTVFTTAIDNNLTCSGSRNVVFTYAGGVGTRTIGSVPAGATFATNSLNYIIQGGTDTILLTGSSGIAVRDLNLTGFSGTFTNNQMFAYGNVTLSATMTLPLVAGNWTLRGPSGGTQTLTTAGKTLPANLAVNAPGGTVVFADDVAGVATATLTLTAGTLNLNNRTVNVGLFLSSGSSARVLAFGTASTLNITGNAGTIWNSAVTSNFSLTGTQVVNCTYAGAIGTRTLSVGTLSVANSVSFNFATGTDTVSLSGSCRSVNFTGFTGTLTSGALTVSGNLTLDAGMTCSSVASQTQFVGTGASQTFTTNGVTFDVPISITSTNPVLLNGILNSPTRAMTVTTGGFNASGYAVTLGSFSSNNSNLRTIDISNITVTLNLSGTPWNMDNSSNATLISSNSTILLANNTTSSRSFRGGNLTYGDIVIGGDTSTSTTEFEGNFTLGTLSSTKTVAHTVAFTAGETVTMSGFTVSGTAGNVVTIRSFTNAVHNLVFTGGGTVNTVDYLDISYSNASPTVDTWYPGLNSVNSGNNTGWMFPVPAGSSNFFLVF